MRGQKQLQLRDSFKVPTIISNKLYAITNGGSRDPQIVGLHRRSAFFEFGP